MLRDRIGETGMGTALTMPYMMRDEEHSKVHSRPIWLQHTNHTRISLCSTVRASWRRQASICSCITKLLDTEARVDAGGPR